MIYIDTYTPPGQVVQNRHVNRFSEEHLKLMVAIGHQAALAVEDTSYYSALVQAERLAAVGQTIATLSHHVKNILQGIRGGSYLIEEGLKNADTELIRKGWNIVDKNQEKISNLVMDMLTFSKERQPERVPAQLNQVTGEVIELMQARAAEAGVTLQWLPDANMPVLQFDPDALHRAILNVVTNAIDACEKTPGRPRGGVHGVPARTRRRRGSPWKTTAKGSRRSIFRRSSPCSSRARAAAAPGWGCPSARRSCGNTAETFGWQAPPTWAASSPWSSPPLPLRPRESPRKGPFWILWPARCRKSWAAICRMT